MKTPETLEECFVELDKMNHPRDIVESWWLKLPEDDAVAAAHFGLGMTIRNAWGLWKSGALRDWFESLEIKQPDDMSGIIIRSYHRLKNNKPINFNEQIEKTIEYYLTPEERLKRKQSIRKNKLEKLNEKDTD